MRDELGIWVIDPEFIDLFEFVVTLGGQTAGFIGELLELAATFVDSKQRQLRLVAFAKVNKMLAQTPRSKIAVLVRADRKPPSRTWRPCPESFWAKEDKGTRLLPEQALLHFSGACRPAIMDMPLARLQSSWLTRVVSQRERTLGGASRKPTLRPR